MTWPLGSPANTTQKRDFGDTSGASEIGVSLADQSSAYVLRFLTSDSILLFSLGMQVASKRILCGPLCTVLTATHALRRFGSSLGVQYACKSRDIIFFGRAEPQGPQTANPLHPVRCVILVYILTISEASLFSLGCCAALLQAYHLHSRAGNFFPSREPTGPYHRRRLDTVYSNEPLVGGASVGTNLLERTYRIHFLD
jgi:hypothetical protein